jgi:hypothetical protein
MQMEHLTFLTSALHVGKWLASRFGRFTVLHVLCRDNSVNTMTRLQAGRPTGVLFPAGAGIISSHHRVQTDSGAHPASYPMCTGGPFPGGKAAEA